MHACMYVCMLGKCLYACMHVCVCVGKCLYACMDVCMHVLQYMHACMYACMYVFRYFIYFFIFPVCSHLPHDRSNGKSALTFLFFLSFYPPPSPRFLRHDRSDGKDCMVVPSLSDDQVQLDFFFCIGQQGLYGGGTCVRVGLYVGTL